MNNPQGYTVIPAPREGVNDDVIRVVEWIVADGARVDEGDPVATLETTKATFDLLATRRGYLHRLVDAGAEVKVGTALALVSEGPERPNHQEEVSRASHEDSSAGQLITKRARELIEQHGLSTGEFIGLSVVRSQDVEEFLHRVKKDAYWKTSGGSGAKCLTPTWIGIVSSKTRNSTPSSRHCWCCYGRG